MKLKQLILPLSVAATLVCGSGCGSNSGSAPSTGIELSSPQLITRDIDPQDYNEIAERFYDSLARSGQIPEGKVVALGPVVENLEDGTHFDHRTFGERLQVLAFRGGLFDFHWGINAQTLGDDYDSVVQERMNIMRLTFEQRDTVDPEELMLIGNMAEVDYLLFGRASSRTVQHGRYSETTYSFSWRLGDCETGLLVWADEMQFTKSGAR